MEGTLSESWFSFFTLALSLSAVMLSWIKYKQLKKSQLLEDSLLISTALDELKRKDLHPLAREKLYMAIAGTSKVEGIEVECILSKKDPWKLLKSYVKCVDLFLRPSVNNTKNFDLLIRKIYRAKLVRYLIQLVYLILYFILGGLALSPIFFTEYIAINVDKNPYSLLLLTLPSFGTWAVIFLRKVEQIKNANMVLKLLEKEH